MKCFSDLALPSCTRDIQRELLGHQKLSPRVHNEKKLHMHFILDLSAWIPATRITGAIPYDTRGNHVEEWRVLVEERIGDCKRILGDRFCKGVLKEFNA